MKDLVLGIQLLLCSLEDADWERLGLLDQVVHLRQICKHQERYTKLVEKAKKRGVKV